MEGESEKMTSVVQTRLHTSSVAVGFFVGLLIQVSPMGIGRIFASCLGSHFSGNISTKQVFLVSFLWSFATSIITLAILLQIRNVLGSIARVAPSNELTRHIAHRVIVGALIGICTTWGVMDVVLGTSSHVVHALTTLAVALSWCQLMMFFLQDKEATQADGHRINDVTAVHV
jgi:uncharacterized membrane protein